MLAYSDSTDGRLRVALVAPFGLRPKGTTIARVLPIARQLAKQGAVVRVIVPPWDDRARSGQRWTDDGLEIVHTRTGAPWLTPAVIFNDLWRSLRDWRPHVVHAFKPIGYSGLVALFLASRHNRPTHASAANAERPLVVVDADDLEGPAGWAGRRAQMLGGVVRGMQERHVLRVADRVTVASRWLETYVTGLGARQGAVRYVPNGYGVDGIQTSADADGAGAQRDSPRLLWYTRFTEASPERIAHLVAPLLCAAPGLRLRVVGEEIGVGGAAAAKSALDRAGVGDRVDWIGYQGLGVDADLPALSGTVAIYPLDDDLVNRARCPSKIPQLMALGIPLVAECVGEAASYLAGFDDTCLVVPGDGERFRTLVSRLLSDTEGRASLSKDLIAAAVKWRWEETSRGLLDWYSEGLEQSGV